MFDFVDIDAINYYREAEEKVIFFFEKPWCDSCESFINKIMQVPEDILNVPVYRVELDMDGGDYIRKQFDVKEAPIAILFTDGKEDKRITDENLFSSLLS